MGTTTSMVSISLVVDLAPPAGALDDIAHVISAEHEVTVVIEVVGKKEVVRIKGATRNVLQARKDMQRRAAEFGGLLRLK